MMSNELCCERVLKLGLWTDNGNVMQGIQERMYVIFGKGGIKNVKVFAVLNEIMTVIRRRVSHDQSA